MRTQYIHENGQPLTAEEVKILQENKQPTKQGQPNFVKIWLLCLLTIVVIAGIVFTAIEITQTQQILDVGENWLKSK